MTEPFAVRVALHCRKDNCGAVAVVPFLRLMEEEPLQCPSCETQWNPTECRGLILGITRLMKLAEAIGLGGLHGEPMPEKLCELIMSLTGVEAKHLPT